VSHSINNKGMRTSFFHCFWNLLQCLLAYFKCILLLPL